jgi:tetratricopeptide (TPR) repeat protein
LAQAERQKGLLPSVGCAIDLPLWKWRGSDALAKMAEVARMVIRLGQNGRNDMDYNVSKSQIKEELRKRWTAQAVESALMGRWDEAVQTNLHILEVFPDDVRAYNRLGRAYTELGRHEEAVEAYEQALQRQPSNPISRKRVTELYASLQREPSTGLKAAMDDDEIDEDEEEAEEEQEEETEADAI